MSQGPQVTSLVPWCPCLVCLSRAGARLGADEKISHRGHRDHRDNTNAWINVAWIPCSVPSVLSVAIKSQALRTRFFYSWPAGATGVCVLKVYPGETISMERPIPIPQDRPVARVGVQFRAALSEFGALVSRVSGRNVQWTTTFFVVFFSSKAATEDCQQGIPADRLEPSVSRRSAPGG